MKYSQEELFRILTEYGKGIPVRNREKKSRYFVDNEAIEHGYAKAFGRKWLVYDILARHANAKVQACFLSYETIMKEGGFKSRNLIAGVIAALVELNIIAIREIPGIKSNVYYLIDCLQWKPITSIAGATGRAVIKRGVKEYLNQQKTSNPYNTLNLPSNSPKEIIGNKVVKTEEKYRSLPPLDDAQQRKQKAALDKFRKWGRNRFGKNSGDPPESLLQ